MTGKLIINHESDPVGYSILYEGANINQLARLFGVSTEVVAKATTKVKAVKKVGRGHIYSVAEIGPHICRPAVSPEHLEEHLKTLHPNQLPMMLRKEFWQAQKYKQDFEKEAGDLWPTDKVIEKVSSLLKLIVMSTRLFSDNVERNTDLTDKQKQVISQLTDGMLDELRKKMVEEFSRSKKEGGTREDEEENDDL